MSVATSTLHFLTVVEADKDLCDFFSKFMGRKWMENGYMNGFDWLSHSTKK